MIDAHPACMAAYLGLAPSEIAELGGIPEAAVQDLIAGERPFPEDLANALESLNKDVMMFMDEMIMPVLGGVIPYPLERSSPASILVDRSNAELRARRPDLPGHGKAKGPFVSCLHCAARGAAQMLEKATGEKIQLRFRGNDQSADPVAMARGFGLSVEDLMEVVGCSKESARRLLAGERRFPDAAAAAMDEIKTDVFNLAAWFEQVGEGGAPLAVPRSNAEARKMFPNLPGRGKAAGAFSGVIRLAAITALDRVNFKGGRCRATFVEADALAAGKAPSPDPVLFVRDARFRPSVQHHARGLWRLSGSEDFAMRSLERNSTSPVGMEPVGDMPGVDAEGLDASIELADGEIATLDAGDVLPTDSSRGFLLRVEPKDGARDGDADRVARYHRALTERLHRHGFFSEPPAPQSNPSTTDDGELAKKAGPEIRAVRLKQSS